MNALAYHTPADEPAPIANVEAEAALLGALMVDNATFDVAIEHLTADDFFEPVHRRIFVAVQDMIAMGRVASPVTLIPQFADDTAMRELGGTTYLAEIAGAAEGGARSGVRTFAAQIAQLARQRSMHERLLELAADVRDTRSGVDPARHAATLETIAFDATASKRERVEIFTAADSIRRVRQRVMAIQAGGTAIGAVAVDLPELTHVLGPLERKHFIVLAGRPGMGKSALAIGAARSMAQGDLSKPSHERRRYGQGFISLEMSDIDIGQRFAADVLHRMNEPVEHARIRDGKLTERELGLLDWAAEQIDDAPIKFIDASGIKLARIAMTARRMKRELQAAGSDLEVLWIDYLQLIHPNRSTDNRVADMTSVSNGLKELAKELDTAVVALSQLSRGVEAREDKRPQMHDLRETGAIEQDADSVGFVYREHYYLKQREPDKDQKPREWESWHLGMQQTRERLDVIVPKRRAGETGSAQLTWLAEYQAVRERRFFANNSGALFDAS